MQSQQKATNVRWHAGEVSRVDRQKLLGQVGATVWFTGLSGSGKSSAAVALEKALMELGHISYRLDGDNVRLGINKNLGFTADDRTENIRRIGEVSKLFVDTGVVDVPLAVAEARDPKGLYKKARAGEIKNFTGIDAPYEEPRNPDLVLPAHSMTLEEEMEALLGLLRQRGVI